MDEVVIHFMTVHWTHVVLLGVSLYSAYSIRANTNRIRIVMAGVQDTGSRIELSAQLVAKNLKEAQERADNTNGLPGEAADAAVRSGVR